MGLKKDNVGTILVSKDSTPPAEDKTGPGSLGFERITEVVTPSAIMVAEEKGSSKPSLAKEKGKGFAESEEAKQAIEDDTPLGEGPFDQDRRRYRVHHAAGKVMDAKQLAEVVGFAEQLGYCNTPLKVA
jgi:hypothetical protein